jgi:hypothetical protein
MLVNLGTALVLLPPIVVTERLALEQEVASIRDEFRRVSNAQELMREREGSLRPLTLAVGRCCCCHRCCQVRTCRLRPCTAAISFPWKLSPDRPHRAGDGLRPVRAGSCLALVF